MRTTAVPLLLLALLLHVQGGPNNVFHYDCRHAGKRYEFSVTFEQLQRSPQWNPRTTPKPPLSAAEAIDKSRQFIATVSPGAGFTWRFSEISLRQAHPESVWVWVASYSQEHSAPKHNVTGPLSSMNVFVLMDGTVPKPSITYEKQP
jgi:hypothetical protein